MAAIAIMMVMTIVSSIVEKPLSRNRPRVAFEFRCCLFKSTPHEINRFVDIPQGVVHLAGQPRGAVIDCNGRRYVVGD